MAVSSVRAVLACDVEKVWENRYLQGELRLAKRFEQDRIAKTNGSSLNTQ